MRSIAKDVDIMSGKVSIAHEVWWNNFVIIHWVNMRYPALEVAIHEVTQKVTDNKKGTHELT